MIINQTMLLVVVESGWVIFEDQSNVVVRYSTLVILMINTKLLVVV
jgi:hypothetical protein